MEKPSLVAAFVLISSVLQAQIISVKKTFSNAVTNQANNTINNEVNKGVNAIFNAPGKIFNKVKQSKNNGGANVGTNVNPSMNTSVMNNPQDTNSAGITKSVSSDFVPGSKNIFSDNFSSTNTGDFPAGWLTNSSGEVRSIDGRQVKWLQLSANGIFAPNQLNDLPENFTMEFDALFHPTPSKDVHYIFYLYSVKDKIADFKETNYPGNAGIYFAFNTAAGEVDAENFENAKAGIIDNHIVTDLLKSELTNQVHVSISKQKTNVALYINGSKVFSSPNALPSGYIYNAFKFGSFFMGQDDFMLIANITIASLN